MQKFEPGQLAVGHVYDHERDQVRHGCLVMLIERWQGWPFTWRALCDGQIVSVCEEELQIVKEDT